MSASTLVPHPVPSASSISSSAAAASSSSPFPSSSSSPSAAGPLAMQMDDFASDSLKGHVLEPNCFNAEDIVKFINTSFKRGSASSVLSNAFCCLIGLCGCCQVMSGRYFATRLGTISIWKDADNIPRAYLPATRQFAANFRDSELGVYDLASTDPFSCAGISICRVNAGNVVFASSSGQPVMITAGNTSGGWYLSVDPSFTFAEQIIVDAKTFNSCTVDLGRTYISYQSLHLFNVEPNHISIISFPDAASKKNQFKILPPGTHNFSSAFLRYINTIPTCVRDIRVTETSVTTADGIMLTNCVAVLSYQIVEEEAQKLFQFDVRNYQIIIEDWALRTMLHEISGMEYQAHRTHNNKLHPGHEHKSSIIGHRKDEHEDDDQEEGATDTTKFRPTLEARMRTSIEQLLSPFGIRIWTFALQSFNPPESLARAVTESLAVRKQAEMNAQAQAIKNETLAKQSESENKVAISKAEAQNKVALSKAEAEAQVILTRANALAEASRKIQADPHSKQLQVLEAHRAIASSLASGNIRTLVMGKSEGIFSLQEQTQNDAK